MANTEAAFSRIMQSSIFRLSGDDIDNLPSLLIDLCEEIQKENDSDKWLYLGEFLDCSCPDLLIGAYWALAEWHGGQASDEYRALSAIGDIYTPNMAQGPEEGTGEEYAYHQMSAWFEGQS